MARSAGWNQSGWPGYVATRWDAFHHVFWHNRSAVVVIDEALAVFREHPEARQMLTGGRHIGGGDSPGPGGGHCCILIGQRHVGMDVTARAQCSEVFAFNVNAADAKLLAEDFNTPALAQAVSLPRFHYLHAARFRPPTHGVLSPP